MYGGPDATAYFVREVRKSTWFTQVPVVLSKAAGNPAFGTDWSVNISRAGDYLLQTWLRVTFPSVTVGTGITADGSIRWTNNLMHNLVQECSITFNDLVAARFDNYHLDFWAAFTTPAGKQQGYANMIGAIPSLTNPVGVPGASLPFATLNLPLPLFYGRDSGVALPTAALPYNDMKINFSFADWTQLLIYNSAPGITGVPLSTANVGAAGIITTTPVLVNSNVWANYAIVSNDERKRMACGPRDILMEQVYTAPLQSFAPLQNPTPSYDLRFSYAVKVMFFASRNNTCTSEWSNYTTVSPNVTGAGTTLVINYTNQNDPIFQTSLIYENTARLFQMGSDYFSLVNPWFHAPVIPTAIGYHQYSYSLEYICLDPMGSTNYGKLTNVSIQPAASAAAVTAAGGTSTTSYQNGQTWQFVTTVVVNNIIRISGGALGKNGKPRTGKCFQRCGNALKGKHCNYRFQVLEI